MYLTEFQMSCEDATCSGGRGMAVSASFDFGLDLVTHFQRLEPLKGKTASLQWSRTGCLTHVV